MRLDEDEWKARLSPDQFRVLRLSKTEPGGSGALLYCFEPGAYACAGCGTALFLAQDKYDSGTGWPAFSDGLLENLAFRDDPIHGMKRTEALCAACGGHLGHLFDDLDSPTRRRYCINSVALRFRHDGADQRD